MKGIIMETLCKSDYQDLYRVIDGVLLVVNKFRYILENDKYRVHTYQRPYDSTPYVKGCQEQLRILKKERHSLNGSVPKDTVVYHGYVVEKCPVDEYEFQIKTTGDLFSGDSMYLAEILEEITEKIGEYKK